MPGVVMYCQIHQPHRLKRYTVFDDHPFYFDRATDQRIMTRVAERCYRPAMGALIDTANRLGEQFGFALSISGVALEQLEEDAPDVIGLTRQLVETGRVELLAETSHHSLAFLYSREEFLEQIALHEQRLVELFGVVPRVFRNTELIYADDLGAFLRDLTRPDGSARYDGVLAEGVDNLLGYRSPNRVYTLPGAGDERPFGLLLKNHRLSDDVAFRFSQQGWSEWPLSASKFAGWVASSLDDATPICNLFMDFETFGEHHDAGSGIIRFLAELPDEFAKLGIDMLTPSEALARHEPADTYQVPEMTSWADTERDLSAWLGNAMQSGSMSELFRLEHDVKRRLTLARTAGDEHEIFEAEHVVNDFRRLTTSDHFYYMCTKHWADGEVHRFFSPYDSPYDAYINFMNVLDSVRARADSTHLLHHA